MDQQEDNNLETGQPRGQVDRSDLNCQTNEGKKQIGRAKEINTLFHDRFHSGDAGD
jgi:hypothetical protein